MLFLKKEPCPELSGIIKNFWMIDSGNDAAIEEEKIIPDGFPEMIFHYKDPYFIDIEGHWQKQDHYLLAGQIRNHFFLRNSGPSGIFAIKFQPDALASLFNIDMSGLTDKVIPINPSLRNILNSVIEITILAKDFDFKVKLVEQWFLNFLQDCSIPQTPGNQIIKLILENNGRISIEGACSNLGITSRYLERYFKKHVGVSPKFYMRIIRFSHIFKLVQNPNFDWSDISYLAGFYDQSHFIKNFREFTGENPTNYGFDHHNLANFFLKS